MSEAHRTQPRQQSRRHGPGAHGPGAIAGGQHRLWIARLAAFALLFQALLPLLHTPPRAAGGLDLPSWVFSSLCRSDAPLDPAAAGERQRQVPSQSAPFCPICQAAQTAGVFLPPHRDDPPLPVDAGRIVPPEAPAILTRSLDDRVHPARAPPPLPA